MVTPLGIPIISLPMERATKSIPLGRIAKTAFFSDSSLQIVAIPPTGFEMIVIPNVGNLIANHCEMFRIGGYDKFVEEVRKQATDNTLSLI